MIHCWGEKYYHITLQTAAEIIIIHLKSFPDIENTIMQPPWNSFHIKPAWAVIPFNIY